MTTQERVYRYLTAAGDKTNADVAKALKLHTKVANVALYDLRRKGAVVSLCPRPMVYRAIPGTYIFDGRGLDASSQKCLLKSWKRQGHNIDYAKRPLPPKHALDIAWPSPVSPIYK
jgi:sugar-specific transcriptional regulator TrmB